MRKIEEPISWFKSKFLVLGILSLGLSACSTAKPHLPMVLAREALQSAKEVDAPRYAPGFYFKAEEAFRTGMNKYKEKAYSAAIDRFISARDFAEKAENSA